MEDANEVGPKERERRLAKQRPDRSHRTSGLVVARERRHPPWTMGEEAALVLSLALIFTGMVIAIVLFLPESPFP